MALSLGDDDVLAATAEWENRRDEVLRQLEGPDEQFEMTRDIVAVDGDTAAVRCRQRVSWFESRTSQPGPMVERWVHRAQLGGRDDRHPDTTLGTIAFDELGGPFRGTDNAFHHNKSIQPG